METMHINRFLLDLGRLSAQAGVLVLLVLAVQWAFRKQLAPRWRCALWLLVALRLVMPFSFSSATSIFNLLPDWPRARTEAPTPRMGPVVSEAVIPQTPMALRGDPASSVPAQIPEVMERPAPASAPSWPVWVLAVWLIGVGVLGGQVAVSSIRFWKRCKKLRALTEPGAVEVLEKCCEQLRVRVRPMLFESVEVKSPGLHGIWSPRLLLPKGFTAQFSREEMQFVFLHELAHLKRRDLLLNWAMAVLQVVHWFNPLVWLGFSQWRADREMVCDAMALEAAGRERNKEYGRTILRLLENFARPISTPGVVGILEDKRQLHRRITMIAGYMPAKGWPVLAAALALGLAAIGLTDARSQATSGELLSMANSQPQGNHDIHINIQNLNSRGSGLTLAAMPATSNFSSWHAEGQAAFETPTNWTAATSNFDAGFAQMSAMGTTASTEEPTSDLTGAWVLVGTPDKIGKVPAAGGRLKFFVGRSFCVTQADPRTGVVIFHHGGDYTVNGNEYVEKVTYANPTTMNFIGGTNGHFNIKVEGDTLTSIGIGNPWKEVWKRADKPAENASQMAKQMIGAWSLVENPGKEGQAPTSGARLKFISGSNWCDTQADQRTGVVVIHHGGTWLLKENEYVETVKYANPGTMTLIGHDYKFTAKVEGDTLTLTGIGNPMNEVWKRVK